LRSVIGRAAAVDDVAFDWNILTWPLAGIF
jgi:hypothetical protein